MLWFSQSQWQWRKRWRLPVQYIFQPVFLQWILMSERIWNNYIDIQDQNMQFIFIILLWNQGYNFLGDPTKQHKVWRKILLNIWPKPSKACIHYSFRLNLLLHTYFIKLMIWSTRKQYYLGFWDFLELKPMNILIKTRVSIYWKHFLTLQNNFK